MSVDQNAKRLKAKRSKAKRSKAKALNSDEFRLSVEFAGICLYVIQDQNADPKNAAKEAVTVLMPKADGRVNTKHEDGETGARHVAYLLMDLANLAEGVQPGQVADGPQFQVVRRLRREELVFEPLEPPGTFITLDPNPLPLPNLRIYDDKIDLKPGMTDGTPSGELDVRTVLRGGELTATEIGGSANGNRRDWPTVADDWAGSIKWTRNIKKDSLPEPQKGSLAIRIRSLDTGKETTPPLMLTPVTRGGEAVIELKIAILCETNPLEWKEFEPKFEKNDRDFKWLFRLFEAIGGGSPLKAIRRKTFPFPKLTPRKARATGTSGCTGSFW